MAEDLSSLGEEDLARLLQVIESLERSAFDFLQLEVGGMKVALGKGDPAGYLARLGGAPDAAPAAPPAASAPPAPPSPAPPGPPPAAAPPVATADGPRAVDGGSPAAPVAAAAQAEAPVAPGVAAEGEVEIRAPMMGVFYAQPEPGAPPYVTVGSVVEPETTVALVEVMKMFNAVPAGMSGTVVAVLVENSQLVEYNQPLFRIRPA